MPYVPGMATDVFVSYATTDDAGDDIRGRWVSKFANDLHDELCRQIGPGTQDDVHMYFAPRTLAAGTTLQAEILGHARNAATFLAVVSPSYVRRDWTLEELRAFAESGCVEHRLHCIETLPLDDDSECPDILRHRPRRRFWNKRLQKDTPYLVEREEAGFRELLQDVACELKRTLVRLKRNGGVAGETTHQRISAVPGQTVFLAQATEDLEESREHARRYFEQFGLAVLPSATYSQRGEDFQAAVRRDLSRSNYFVQLLSAVRGRQPADLPEGYPAFQLRAAKEAQESRPELRMFVWCRPDSETDQLDRERAALLNDPSIYKIGIEAFKKEVVNAIQKDQLVANKVALPQSNESINIFINADLSDYPLAKELQQRLDAPGVSFTTLLPTYDNNSQAYLDDVTEKVIWCDALALVYGNVPPGWVGRQVMLYSKLRSRRERPARAVFVCFGPPKPKPEHGVRMPELCEIEISEEASQTLVEQMLLRLRG